MIVQLSAIPNNKAYILNFFKHSMRAVSLTALGFFKNDMHVLRIEVMLSKLISDTPMHSRNSNTISLKNT